MVFELEAIESAADDKKGGPVDDFGAENRHFSTRASCFRAFGTFKNSLKNACFDESIMFQASFDRVKNSQNIEF